MNFRIFTNRREKQKGENAALKQKEKLFCYGTLMDEEIQQILFGEKLIMQEASLYGWKKYQGKDGYLFISRACDGVIYGNVIELTPKQLKIADLWEEVPVYKREKVNVVLKKDLSEELVWVYTKAATDEEVVHDDRIVNIDRNKLLEEAKSVLVQLHNIQEKSMKAD